MRAMPRQALSESYRHLRRIGLGLLRVCRSTGTLLGPGFLPVRVGLHFVRVAISYHLAFWSWLPQLSRQLASSPIARNDLAPRGIALNPNNIKMTVVC